MAERREIRSRITTDISNSHVFDFVNMSITTGRSKSAASTARASHGGRLSDEQLLLSYCRTGDYGHFAQLVYRYERELYSYLRRYSGSAEMAEDAFQSTFLQVHLKCDQFDGGRKFRPWLYAIATNQAIDLQRRNRRHRAISLELPGGRAGEDEMGRLIDLLESSEAGPLGRLQEVERRDWVRRELSVLPEHLRSVVLLVYYQGLKYREAADALDIPVGTVKSRLHSAILKLNEAWHTANTKPK